MKNIVGTFEAKTNFTKLIQRVVVWLTEANVQTSLRATVGSEAIQKNTSKG